MTTPAPGALVFCHSKGLVANAIRFGEWLRFRPGDFWNHVAIVEGPAETGHDIEVIQAAAKGVVRDLLSTIAPGGSYEIVTLPPGVIPSAVVAYARSQLGCRYGWLSVASVALQIIVPTWMHLPSLRSRKTWICSALAGECVAHGTWVWDTPDIYQVVPSELYAALAMPTPHVAGPADPHPRTLLPKGNP